jgi:cation diffusion facilitator CzcD-associated flavoprotein CzcO
MTFSADVISISSVLGDASVGTGPGTEHNISNDSNDFGGMSGINGVKSVVSSILSLDHAERKPNWVPMVNRVLWEPEKRIKVVSIGCGFSGLTLAQKIQHKYKLDQTIDHVIYEKNSEIGGTWYEVGPIYSAPEINRAKLTVHFKNRYPGVMCDVPAHIYTLLDIPNTEWPAFYATGDEIQNYLRKITREYNLDRDVVYESTVTSAIWNEDDGLWHLEIQQHDKTIKDSCQILINGSGVLNAWSWPDIKGLSNFKGHLSHSADYQDWAKKTSFEGKRVAVIGNGSSAIQIVPEVAKVASHLTNIVRSPTWISAPFVEDLSGAPGSNPAYSEEQKEHFRKNPEAHLKHRHELAHAFNHFYEALIEDSPANKEAMKRTKALMEERLAGHPEIQKQVIPEWSLGCRRLTPGNGYLETLISENTDLLVGHIGEVTETGIRMTDGSFREFDAIICAYATQTS